MSWLWSTPNQPFRDFKRVPDPPEDAHDRHALALARAQRTRDYFVAVEEMKMLQEQLSLCYMRSGVNSREDCKELAEAYLGKTRARNYGAHDPSGVKSMMKVRAAARGTWQARRDGGALTRARFGCARAHARPVARTTNRGARRRAPEHDAMSMLTTPARTRVAG